MNWRVMRDGTVQNAMENMPDDTVIHGGEVHHG
jgi:hypothetical protein